MAARLDAPVVVAEEDPQRRLAIDDADARPNFRRPQRAAAQLRPRRELPPRAVGGQLASHGASAVERQHDGAQRQDLRARRLAGELLDVGVGRLHDQFLGRADLDQPSVAHDGNAIRQADRPRRNRG